MSVYAPRIRAARAFAGLTQEKLAGRLGIDTQTVKRREAGTQDPKRGELLAIAAVCGVPTSFMEHGFGEVEPSEVLDRLDRIEHALVGAGPALEPVRDYARGVITELREDEDAPESTAPSPQPAPDPPPEAQPAPPARSRRRS